MRSIRLPALQPWLSGLLMGVALGLGLTALAGSPPATPPRVTAWDETTPRFSPSGMSEVRELARGKNAYLGLVRMSPGATIPEHTDPTEEYVHVLSGHGTLVMNGVTHAIAPGATITMPAGARVSFTNGPGEMRAVQVFAGPRSADKYASWSTGPSPAERKP